MKKESKPISIKYRLFEYFGAFIVATIAFLWFFQILFLDNFYRFIKTQEIKATSDIVVQAIEQESAEETLGRLAFQRDLCMQLVNMDSGTSVKIETRMDCLVHKLPSATILGYYDLALENGGTYLETIEARDLKNFGVKLFRNENTYLLYSQVVNINGVDILIVIDTSIAPLNATVNTIRIQLVVLSVVLVILALIIAFIANRRISKPIMGISASALEMGKGDLDIEFKGEGYKEIHDLADTLNHTEKELKKASELQKELIANVSHDLRTPLTMIEGYAEVMRDLPGENNAENAQIIIDEANRLSSLVSDVLDISKLNADTATINAEAFSLTDSINKMLERYKKFVERDGYDIEFDYQEDVVIEADELRISQVVYNLINNALTYTGDDKKVIIKQTTMNDYVRIEVIDHGKGIAEDEIPYIWDRYMKANNQYRRPVNGTGLGLSIVKSTLEAHNKHFAKNVANYGATSKLNEGSNFYFEYLIKKN